MFIYNDQDGCTMCFQKYNQLRASFNDIVTDYSPNELQNQKQ